jgi:hypothetical protein
MSNSNLTEMSNEKLRHWINHRIKILLLYTGFQPTETSFGNVLKDARKSHPKCSFESIKGEECWNLMKRCIDEKKV